MEMAVPRSHNSDIERTAAALLDDAVTSYRNHGHTREHALRLAARVLGLRVRRAKALLYGEPVVLLDDELTRIRTAFLKHLEAEAEDLAVRSAAARERLRRMRDGKP